MRKIIPTIAFAIGVSTAAIAQQPAPMTLGLLRSLPGCRPGPP
jgi:hypothetical protein